VAGTEEIVAALDGYGAPAPSLLPWAARWAAGEDLVLVARVAAAQAALAPLLRWPAVTDAVAEVLAWRARTIASDPLIAGLAEVLPSIAAHLGQTRVTGLARAGVRADALAYASLTQPGRFDGEAAVQSLGPLWQEVLSATQAREVPPLANLRLLARLIRVPAEPLGSFLGSEVVYLLPFRHDEDDWVTAAVTEIEDCIQGDDPWYAAALFARAAPYLDGDQRSSLADQAGDDWREAYRGVWPEARSQRTSAQDEVQASHPALARLRDLADHSTRADLAAACATIVRDMSRTYGNPTLERWEPDEPAPEPPEREPLIIRSDWEARDQGRLDAAGYEVGQGERIQLPGISTRYRLLEFTCSRCARPGPEYRIYYDDEDLPTCPDHGPMELLR
jgi:hypothetical protein